MISFWVLVIITGAPDIGASAERDVYVSEQACIEGGKAALHSEKYAGTKDTFTCAPVTVQL